MERGFSNSISVLWPWALGVLVVVSLLAAGDAALAAQPDGGARPRSADHEGIRSSGSTAASDDIVARDSYELAIFELSQNRQREGQRRLEALIAAHPDSPFADAVRAKIVELYTAPVRNAPRSQLGVPVDVAPLAKSQAWHVEIHRAPIVLDEFRVMVGDRVFFAPGSAELGSRAMSVLQAQANWLKHRPGVRMSLEAHADDPGNALDNRILAERRAEVVRRRLIAEGVAPDRIRVTAHGIDKRVALCPEPVCAAQNRRVVSIIEDTGEVRLAAMGDRSPAGGNVSAGVPR